LGCEEISARKWKKYFGLTSDKLKSVEKAEELFAGEDIKFRGPKGGLKDGRAEALLLAYYAQRQAEKGV